MIILIWLLGILLHGTAIGFIWREYRWGYSTPSWRHGWFALGSAFTIGMAWRVFAFQAVLWEWLPALTDEVDICLATVQSALILLGFWYLSHVLRVELPTITLPEAHVSIDSYSVIVAWDHGAELIFGWTATEVLGQTLMQTVMPAQAWEAHRAGIARVLAAERLPSTITIAGLARRKDNSLIPVTVEVKAEQGAEGVLTFHGVIRRMVAL